MSWQGYKVVFRLESPLHIGWRMVGNLKQTRGYVPSRNMWAALTARLTRDAGDGADGRRYEEIGSQVKEFFRFSYLYPALRENDGYIPHYPWEDDFDYLFLDSYASAALDYTRQAAEGGLLHETEFIAPYTRTGSPVYLTGALYVRGGDALPEPLKNWKDALFRLQLGGEQGYGWGRIRLETFKGQDGRMEGEPPVVEKVQDKEGRWRIIAHLDVGNPEAAYVHGPIEPQIGWERDNRPDSTPKWRLSSPTIAYAPGAVIAPER